MISYIEVKSYFIIQKCTYIYTLKRDCACAPRARIQDEKV